MYYRVDTNEVFSSHSEIRNSFMKGDSVVFFSEVITDADLEARGVFPLKYDKPEVEEGEIAEPSSVELVDGQWEQKWEVRAATPEEIEAEKPPVPFSVTRRQARQALAIKGLLDSIEPAIDALDDGTTEGKQRALLTKIEWQDSLNFERYRPMVMAIGKCVGLTDSLLDDLFRFAATL